MTSGEIEVDSSLKFDQSQKWNLNTIPDSEEPWINRYKGRALNVVIVAVRNEISVEPQSHIHVKITLSHIGRFLNFFM